MSKYSIEMSDVFNKSDKTNAIIDIKRSFLSECTIADDKTILFKKIRSELEFESNVSFDDICGPWKFNNVPLQCQRGYVFSTLHVPKLIMPEDVTYMREQQNKKFISLFLEKKVLRNILYNDRNREILVKILWQTFKFFKEKLFTDHQISTILELMLSTHRFYVTNYWNTSEQIHKYFFEQVLLYTIMDPPKCVEIFTPNETGIIFKFFREIYLENLILLHLLCMTHYRIVMRLDDQLR